MSSLTQPFNTDRICNLFGAMDPLGNFMSSLSKKCIYPPYLLGVLQPVPGVLCCQCSRPAVTHLFPESCPKGASQLTCKATLPGVDSTSVLLNEQMSYKLFQGRAPI